MPFELTINRVGSFAGMSRRELAGGDGVEALFRRQLEELTSSDMYEAAWTAIVSVAPSATDLEPDAAEDLDFSLLRLRHAPPFDDRKVERTLVGSLPGKRLRCRTAPEGRREWIVRIRASVTACSFADGGEDTKLWWTFEGVPATDDPDDRPDETDVLSFVDLTDRMADAAIPPLFEAYRSTLGEGVDASLKGSRVRVRMTDSNDAAVEALLDAAYYESLDEAAIITDPSHGQARDGLLSLRSFARNVVRSDAPRWGALTVEANFEGVKGLMLRAVTDADETIVAGFGHRQGSVSGMEKAVARDKRRLQKNESALRGRSASRPISAFVADREAVGSRSTP